MIKEENNKDNVYENKNDEIHATASVAIFRFTLYE